MIAFVLSGGGNRGALQAGAMKVLLDRGIVPDILIGTSVGAINAAYLASGPSPETALELEQLWAQVTDDDVYPGSRLAVLWRLLRRQNSLYPSDNLYRFLRERMPAGIETFGDVTAAELYIVATHLETGRMHVFGERPAVQVVDAIMASTALPPFHPPWSVEGDFYFDGGAVSDLPLRVAVKRGALHLPAPATAVPLVYGLGDVAGRAISALVQQQVALDFETVTHAPGVALHHIELCPPGHLDLSYRDFSQSAKLVMAGRDQAERYLDSARREQPADRRERFLTAIRRTAEQVRAVLPTMSTRRPQTVAADRAPGE